MRRSFFFSLVIMLVVIFAASVTQAEEPETIYMFGRGTVQVPEDDGRLFIYGINNLAMEQDSQTIVTIYIDTLSNPIYEEHWGSFSRELLRHENVGVHMELAKVADTSVAIGLYVITGIGYTLRQGIFLIQTDSDNAINRIAVGIARFESGPYGPELFVNDECIGRLGANATVRIYTKGEMLYQGDWQASAQHLVSKKGRVVHVMTWGRKNPTGIIVDKALFHISPLYTDEDDIGK